MATTLRTICALSIGLTSIVYAGMAVAQQKYSYNNSTKPQSSRYVQQHIIDVGEIPGHQVRIFGIHRQYTRGHPVVRGTKVVENRTRGSSD